MNMTLNQRLLLHLHLTEHQQIPKDEEMTEDPHCLTNSDPPSMIGFPATTLKLGLGPAMAVWGDTTCGLWGR